MGKSLNDIYQGYLEQSKESDSNYQGSLYYKKDILYSYGRHFPLMIRMNQWGIEKYLMNADKYSNTTSKHQTMCFRKATVQLSFTLIEQSIGIDIERQYNELILIDKQDEVWEKTGKWMYYDKDRNKLQKVITKSEFNQLSDAEQVYCTEQEERRPQHCVFKFDNKYYLSGMDGNEYFISELPEPVTSVEEAIDCLRPIEIKECDSNEILRQGEWFFVELPVTHKEARIAYNKVFERNFVLPKVNEQSNDHIATRGGFLMDISLDDIPCFIDANARTIVVSGSIRHSQHRTLQLCNAKKEIKLFAAFRNREVQSWTSTAAGIKID